MSAKDPRWDIVERVPKDLFIGGAWRPAHEGRTFDVEDPSTGEVLCAVADATPADGLTALDAALKAQESWAQHPPRERGEILRRAYETILRRQERLASQSSCGAISRCRASCMCVSMSWNSRASSLARMPSTRAPCSATTSSSSR